ncbi:hypothetical protein ACPYO6_07695 [Georgenia sp. Z1344]|uniref:hypothetical protein n=1 Tax=Georgenia sp. Z1344 TaxID=3416706 RepID=UPI003CEB5DBE
MRRDDRRRRVVLVLGVLVLIAMISPFILPLLANGATPADTSDDDTPVVVLGTGGLTWEDIDDGETPRIAELAAEGYSANLVVRSVGSTTCRTDGWLALSAGQRAAGERDGGDCLPPAPVGTETGTETGGEWQVPGWSEYVEGARTDRFDAVPGTLGGSLAEAGRSAVAIGGGAAVALAEPDGTVADARPTTDDDAELGALTASAIEDGADLVVVDLDPADATGRAPDGEAAPGEAAPGEESPGEQPPGARTPAELDARVGAVVDALAETGSEPTILLASLYDGTRTSTLQALALTGAGEGSGLATSPATRTDGMVQAPDLLPTVLSLLDVDQPTGLVGSALVTRPGDDDPADRAAGLRDVGVRALAVAPLVSPAVLWLVGLNIGLGAAALVGLNRRVLAALGGTERARHRVLRVLRAAALVVASLPVALIASSLLPWWRFEPAGLALAGVTVAGALLLALVAVGGPWRHSLVGPTAVVSGVTAVVIAADVMLGSHLFLGSVLGTQPQIGARYFGMSNHYFALFATASLLLAATAAQALVARGRGRAAAAAALAIGAVATAIDGWPAFGADFGGPPAMIPAFVVLALLVAGVRVTWPRVLLIGAVTVAVVATVSLLDWLRPPDERTHLGRFVGTLLDGGAFDVIWRKLGRNLEILVSSPLTVLAAVGAIVVVVLVARPLRRPDTAATSDYGWLVRRPETGTTTNGTTANDAAATSSPGTTATLALPEAAQVLKPAAVALLILWIIGFAVNDSGIVIPALGVALAVPLTLALLASWLLERPRHGPLHEADDRGDEGARTAVDA